MIVLDPPLGSNDWWALWCWQITGDEDNVPWEAQVTGGTSRFAAVQDEE